MPIKKLGKNAKQKTRSTRGKQSLRLWLRLLACENLIEQHVRSNLKANFNITLPQFDVLSELEFVDAALTMSQLSQRLMVSNGNVTGVVDRLERDGYVKRSASTTDRRVQYIALTPKGASSFQEMAHTHEQWIEGLFADLSGAEIKSMLVSLDNVKAAITARLN